MPPFKGERPPVRDLYPRPMTLKQVHRRYLKSGRSLGLPSEIEMRRIERLDELDQRAEKIRKKERRRKVNEIKRKEKLEEDRQKRVSAWKNGEEYGKVKEGQMRIVGFFKNQNPTKNAKGSVNEREKEESESTKEGILDEPLASPCNGFHDIKTRETTESHEDHVHNKHRHHHLQSSSQKRCRSTQCSPRRGRFASKRRDVCQASPSVSMKKGKPDHLLETVPHNKTSTNGEVHNIQACPANHDTINHVVPEKRRPLSELSSNVKCRNKNQEMLKNDPKFEKSRVHFDGTATAKRDSVDGDRVNFRGAAGSITIYEDKDCRDFEPSLPRINESDHLIGEALQALLDDIDASPNNLLKERTATTINDAVTKDEDIFSDPFVDITVEELLSAVDGVEQEHGESLDRKSKGKSQTHNLKAYSKSRTRDKFGVNVNCDAAVTTPTAIGNLAPPEKTTQDDLLSSSYDGFDLSDADIEALEKEFVINALPQSHG